MVQEQILSTSFMQTRLLLISITFFLLTPLLVVAPPGCGSSSYIRISGTCFLCSSLIANCNTCSSSTTCTSCTNSGYFLSSGTCISCASKLPNCATCSSDTTCTSCASSSFVLSAGSCVTCASKIPNCSTCSSSSICTSCVNNTLVISTGACITCLSKMANCLTCTSTTTCTSCVNTTLFISIGACVSCSSKITNCLTCTSNTTCTSCNMATLAVYSGSCQSCCFLMSNCQTCSSDSVCLSCNNTRYVINTLNKCDYCSSLIPNCSTCTSSSNCLTCDIGFFRNSSNLCAQCRLKFLDCGTCNETICLSCISASFYLTPTGCLPCNTSMPYCLTCTSSNHCSSCENTHALISNNSGCQPCSLTLAECSTCYNRAQCSSCSDNDYALNYLLHCELCSTLTLACETCLNQNQCLSCVDNTYLYDPSTYSCPLCSSVILNCYTCQNQTICLSCSHLSFWNVAGTCTLCSSHIHNCGSCVNETLCLSCLDSRFYLQNITSCTYCSKYIANCQRCSSLSVCIECIDNTYYVEPVNKNCQLCSDSIQMCITCASDRICLSCLPEFKVSNGKCVCMRGILVDGVCINVLGCIQAIKINGIITCLQCNTTNFESIPVKNKCVCKSGKAVDDVCIDAVGCIAAELINKIAQCSFCDTVNKFSIDKFHKCVCQFPYKLVNELCQTVCGDGSVSGEECDDGNLVDGDGCSSNCTVEDGFLCNNGTAVYASRCVYDGVPPNMSLIRVQHTKGENQGVFYFSISPFLSILSNADLFQFVSLKCNSTFQVASADLEGEILKVVVDFEEDLELLPARLEINFSPESIIVSNISYSFAIRSEDVPLRVSHMLAQLRILELTYTILGYSLLLVFVVSLYFHKMIGVELLQACQVAYFMGSIFREDESIMFSATRQFSVVNGYNQFFAKDAYRYFLGEFSRVVSINHQYLQSFLILVILQAVIVLVFSFLEMRRIKYKNYLSQDGNKLSIIISTEYKKAALRSKQFYYILAYPIVVGFMQMNLLSLFANNIRIASTSDSTFPPIFNGIVQILGVTPLTVVVSHELLHVFRNNLSPQYMEGLDRCSRYYIPSFLFWAIAFNLGLSLQIVFGSQLILYLLCGPSFVFFLFILALRPYHSKIHNFGLIMCQLVTVLSSAVTILNYMLQLSQYLQFVSILAIQSLIGFNILFTILRICIEWKYSKKHKKVQKDRGCERQMNKNQLVLISLLQQNLVKDRNVYRLQTQALKRWQNDENDFNKIRRDGQSFKGSGGKQKHKQIWEKMKKRSDTKQRSINQAKHLSDSIINKEKIRQQIYKNKISYHMREVENDQ